MSAESEIGKLKEELQLRKRAIMFLLIEYVARHEDQREEIASFLQEVMPDMPANMSAVAREMLDALQQR